MQTITSIVTSWISDITCNNVVQSRPSTNEDDYEA
jgi:hypothetical protein